MQTKAKSIAPAPARLQASKVLRALAVWAVALTIPVAFAKHPKLAKDLDGIQGETVDIIVQYKTTPTAKHHDKLNKKNGKLKSDLRVVKGALYNVPVSELEAIANDPDVAFITPDRAVGAASDQAMPTIGADLARYNGWEGTAIGVAVIDSGVYTAPDLDSKASSQVSRVVYSENFVPNQTGTSDGRGHGTHVAGIIAGSGKISTCASCTQTFRGVATNANIINLRVLKQDGTGTDSAVIAAIQRAIALKNTYNIRVINLSLGRGVLESYRTDPLCQAAEAAWKAGIVVVVSAGNNGRDNSKNTNGYGMISSPGNDPYVITVGAMKTMNTASPSDDRIASYSSKGPTAIDHIVKPDLVAPGNKIIAAYFKNSQLAVQYPANIVPLSFYGGTTNASQYFWLSGTSMAAPMVSGAAALIIQRDPSLTPDLVKARLMRTATKPSSYPLNSTSTDPATGTVYSTRHDIFSMGAGYLNVWAALNDTSTAAAGKTALSPLAVRNASTGAVSLSILWGETVLWGETILWGESAIWGSSAFVSGSTILWGDSIVWNNSSAAGNTILWGDTVLWGDNKPQGEATTIAIGGEN